jgi:hypothetical protein
MKKLNALIDWLDAPAQSSLQFPYGPHASSYFSLGIVEQYETGNPSAPTEGLQLVVAPFYDYSVDGWADGAAVAFFLGGLK